MIVVRPGYLGHAWIIRMEDESSNESFAVFPRFDSAVEVALLLAEHRKLHVRIETEKEKES